MSFGLDRIGVMIFCFIRIGIIMFLVLGMWVVIVVSGLIDELVIGDIFGYYCSLVY